KSYQFFFHGFLRKRMLLEIILLDVPSSARREEYLTYHSYLHDNHIHTAGRLDYQRSNFR
ncbi:MAG: hypothetical protein ABGX43_05355, partial [Nitrospinaceae bacterium]